MQIERDVLLAPYTTFHVGGRARFFARVTSEDDVVSAVSFGQERNIFIVPLGGGSNVIFGDDDINAVVLKLEIRGISVVSESSDEIVLCVGAGEVWDEFVTYCVAHHFCGIEALSAIPGTVGATAVQNVGAYGREVKDVIVTVRVYDSKARVFVDFSNNDCVFGYRDSIFRNKEAGRYIITFITFRLLKTMPAIPAYPDVIRYFSEKNISSPSIRQIRDAIIEIRSRKLPDPKTVWNVGSFFKNPIIPKVDAERLRALYPDMPVYPASDDKVKVSAGWLIEKVGLKGEVVASGVQVYPYNALVLTNTGVARREDVVLARDVVVRAVQEKFGIVLEAEPLFIS